MAQAKPKENTVTTTHIIPTDALRDKYGDGIQSAEGVRVLVEGTRGVGFGFIYCPATASCRREIGQDPVPGPYVGAYGLAAIIADCGGTSAEIAAERAAGRLIEAKIGDRLDVNGDLFTIDFYRRGSWIDRHNIELTYVAQ